MSDKDQIMQGLKDAATGSQAFDLDGDEWVKELDGWWRCQAFSMRASSVSLYHSGGRLPNVRMYLVVNNASGGDRKTRRHRAGTPRSERQGYRLGSSSPDGCLPGTGGRAVSQREPSLAEMDNCPAGVVVRYCISELTAEPFIKYLDGLWHSYFSTVSSGELAPGAAWVGFCPTYGPEDSELVSAMASFTPLRDYDGDRWEKQPTGPWMHRGPNGVVTRLSTDELLAGFSPLTPPIGWTVEP